MKITRIFKEYYFYLFFLMLVAIGLRFYKLGEWSLWGDEWYTLQQASAPYPIGSQDTLSQWCPILFILVKVSFWIFGINEWSARIVSCLTGIITIPLFYLLIKEMFDKKVAFLCVVLITFSDWHLFHSQNARFYTLTFLFGGLSIFTFSKGLEQNNQRFILISSLLTLIATLTHTTSFLIIPVIGGYLILIQFISKPTGFTLRNMLIYFLPQVILIPFVYYHGTIWYQAGHKVHWGISNPGYFFSSIIYNIGPTVSIFTLFTLFYLWIKKDRRGLLLGLYIIIPFFALFIYSLIGNVGERYLFFTAPGYFVLASYGCIQIFEQLKGKQRLLGVCIIVVLVGNYFPSVISHYLDGGRFNYKAAANFIKKSIKETDLIVSESPAVIEYYTHLPVIKIPYDKTEFEKIKKLGRRTWFIVPFTRSGIKGRQEVLDCLYENCKIVKEFRTTRYDIHQSIIQIYLFEFKNTLL